MKALSRQSYQVVPGEYYGTPKELWGFRSDRGRGNPRNIAKGFLAENAQVLGLEPDLRTLAFQKTIPSLGAEHVIFQQHHTNLRVHRAYVTVHIGRRDQRVYMTKNRAMPCGLLPKRPATKVKRNRAEQLALRTIRSNRKGARVLSVEQMWMPDRDRLCLTWRVRLHRNSPREEWLVYVDALTGKVWSQWDNLARATGRVRVFDPNPVIALDDHRALLTPRGNARRNVPAAAYQELTLSGLAGTGRLDGRRVTTRPTKRRIKRLDGQFLFDAGQKGFEETMAYFHLDRAIRYLESLGFRGPRAIFREPLKVKANGTRQDNSWYSPGLKQLTFGTGGVDDAEDAETILHEFGHAIQDAIVPDFGQSEQAAAMGEGFGDYFAASFFAEQKSDVYRGTVMSWDGITWERDDGPPCVRRVDEDWTNDDFIPGDSEHNNGEIWSTTLWDIRESLGRRDADRIILESHFQLDDFTTFDRGARAILDADQNLNDGSHRARLRTTLRSRKIAPVS